MKLPPRLVFALLAAGFVADAQTTLNVSKDLVALGIASTNMVPNQPTLDAGPPFFRAVLYANAHQIGRVIADPGAYYFNSLQYSGAHVAWDSLSNLTIDLQGSDLYFSNPLVNGMVIFNSTNLVLENFTADYNPLPFTQVRVVSANAAQRQVQFAVDGNWQNPSVLNAVFAQPATSDQALDVHIFRNGRPISGVPRMNAANPVGTSQFTIAPDPTGFATNAVIAQIRPGDIAVLGMKLGSGPVNAIFCTGCIFRNITAYSGTDWGFNLSYLSSSVLERLYSIPRPGTDRLVSNYDGFFLANEQGQNQLRFNRAIRTMDNGFEYGTDVIGTVMSQANSRTLVLKGSLTSQLTTPVPVPSGTAVAFERISDGAILASAVTASPVAPPYSGQPPQATFTFDRDLPANVVGTIMYASGVSQPGSDVFERNALEEQTDCCHGFYINGRANSVFRGNYIRRSAMAGLHMENALQPGNLNSPPTANFAITNNVFDAANWTRTGYPLLQLGSITVDGTDAPVLLTSSPNQSISVTGNFIADSGSAAVWLGNTSGGTVTGNYFLNPDNNPAVVSAESFFGPTLPLVIQASTNIAMSNNTVDRTSGRMWVTDVQYRELAGYAPGSIVRLNAYDLGTLPNPNISLTDADGNASPVTIIDTSAHAIDVQLPTAAATGGAYLTFTSGNLTYFATLFVDPADNVPVLNGCTYQVSSYPGAAGGGYGSLPVLVVTQGGCAYQLLDTDSYVTLGPGGSGTGVISVGFAANSGASRTTTVEIAGQPIPMTQSSQGAVPASRFVAITPCRLADTRNANGPFGGPTLAANSSRTFTVPNSTCKIPATATAFSLNVAVVPQGPLGYLTVWPAGQLQPFVATLTSLGGAIRANAAIVPAEAAGGISVFATNTTDVVLDINGYFVPASDPTGLAFYPLTPCRVTDTRNAPGPLGGPSLAPQGTRTFPVAQSSCGIPASAQAYALNFAAVPKGSLGYLTAWPTGAARPLAASLTAPTGTITANAVIVQAGSNGSVDVFSTDATDLVIDITGYFAPPGPGGLSLYNLPPCRVLDTRQAGSAPLQGTLNVNVSASGCGPAPSALAYVFNATVVPPAPFGYLTLWAQAQPQPLAATLNAVDGAITSNLAITPTRNGMISAFASDPTQLVLDVFGYFAP